MARGRPFQKGHPKPPNSGRRKGIPSSAKARAFSAAEACREAGIDPFAILAEMASGNGRPGDQLPAAEALCKYLAPQLKSVEWIDPATDARLTEIEKALGIATDASPQQPVSSTPN